jgi:hypothetical protein
LWNASKDTTFVEQILQAVEDDLCIDTSRVMLEGFNQFAGWNGCFITTLPSASTGSHVCTDYTGCPAAYPVRWCSYDGGHTPSPTDAGQFTSWMPDEVWTFLSAF